MPKFLWNVYAHCYDAITGLAPYQDMLDDVVAALEVAPGMRVLDAGCGTGVLAERLAATCPDIEVVAVDLSPSMLKRARARRKWPASFAFVDGTIEEVLAKDQRGFDRMASVNVIWALPDPQATFAQMATHLRPNGRMVHTTPRWRFRAYVILWRHFRRQKGRALARALLDLPMLLLAGLLNLLLVGQSLLLARGPDAKRRWDADGLAKLLGAATVPPRLVKTCYAGQGHLLVSEKLSQPQHQASGPTKPTPAG
jgi:SAM-dependent methyltransferase